MMEELASGKSTTADDPKVRDALVQTPCAIWDDDQPECQAKRLGEAAFARYGTTISQNVSLDQTHVVRDSIDAVYLMGDLNYRLVHAKDDGTFAPFPEDINTPKAEEWTMAKLVSTSDGRQRMFADDPLNP